MIFRFKCIVIFILFILYHKLYEIANRYIIKRKILSKEDIYYEEKFPNISEAFNKSKIFLYKCLKGILISNKTYNISGDPKISAIINFYNSQKTISRAIKSIQNQNISDIEIIMINDFSSDNSLSIVENIKKNDSRIKIINNKKNMGTLFSRSIGALYSKGKYIFHLDSDDMFLDEDVFSVTTEIAEKGNFDIVSFRSIRSCYGGNILTNQIKENPLNYHINNKVLFQNELSLYPVRTGRYLGKYIIKENFMWSKCFKTKVYQTTLNIVGIERYSRYMTYEEDRAILYALFNVAESLKFIGKYGILQIWTQGSMTKRRRNYLHQLRCFLYFADIVIALNKESKRSRKLLVYIITFLINIFSKRNDELNKFNEYDRKLFISCLNRILNDKYISNKDKKEIRKRVSTLKAKSDIFNISFHIF